MGIIHHQVDQLFALQLPRGITQIKYPSRKHNSHALLEHITAIWPNFALLAVHAAMCALIVLQILIPHHPGLRCAPIALF